MSPQPASIRIRHRVDWLDTDAAGISHWTTVARFAEAAEAALHAALGITGETFGVTPRLSVSFDFRSALRFDDEAWVELAVESVGRSSVTYALTVTRLSGELVATGQIVTCLVEAGEAGDARSREWPDHLRSALLAGGPQVPVRT